MTKATFESLLKLTGHNTVVQCCAFSEGRLCSGAEDGRICVHEPGSGHATAVTKINVPTDSTSNAQGNTTEDSSGISSLAWSPTQPHTLYAACRASIHTFDIRSGAQPVNTYPVSKDDVSSLAVHPKGSYLAASDDAGEIQLIDLTSGKQYKCIRGAHGSIASSVAFRHASKPWELVSGGLDSTVARYDFSRPKCIDRWNMSSLAGSSGGGGQMYNPPFVHQVAVSPLLSQESSSTGAASSSCGHGSSRSAAGSSTASSSQPQQLVAAACGDGSIVLLDPDFQSSAAPPPWQAPTPAGASLNGKAKSKGGSHAPAALGPAASSSEGVSMSSSSPEGLQAGKPDKFAARRPVAIGLEMGGHSAPVASVCFSRLRPVLPPQQQGEGGEADRHTECAVFISGQGGRADGATGPLASLPASTRGQGVCIYSGSEDRVIKLWDVDTARTWQLKAQQRQLKQAANSEQSALSGTAAGDEDENLGVGSLPLLGSVVHGRKINQICCGDAASSAEEMLYVAAVSKFVTGYHVRCEVREREHCRRAMACYGLQLLVSPAGRD